MIQHYHRWSYLLWTSCGDGERCFRPYCSCYQTRDCWLLVYVPLLKKNLYRTVHKFSAETKNDLLIYLKTPFLLLLSCRTTKLHYDNCDGEPTTTRTTVFQRARAGVWTFMPFPLSFGRLLREKSYRPRPVSLRRRTTCSPPTRVRAPFSESITVAAAAAAVVIFVVVAAVYMYINKNIFKMEKKQRITARRSKFGKN